MRSPDTQRALDRWETWRTRYEAKLAGYHPDVRLDLEATVRDRFLAGNFEPLSEEARRECMMRAASRLRVARGPAGTEGSGDQLREVLEQIQGQRRAAA